MRLEPEPVKVAPTPTVQRDNNATTFTDTDHIMTTSGQESSQTEPVASTSQVREQTFPPVIAETETGSGTATPLPDSTQPGPEPVISPVGPHGAIVFSALEESAQYQDLDDEFFDLSLDEVKTLYRD